MPKSTLQAWDGAGNRCLLQVGLGISPVQPDDALNRLYMTAPDTMPSITPSSVSINPPRTEENTTTMRLFAEEEVSIFEFHRFLVPGSRVPMAILAQVYFSMGS